MSNPRILVFAGSIRTGPFNARLAAIAAKELALAGAEVTHISLQDYPLPIYDGDLEASSGAPENAIKLKRMMMGHPGVFIASPEYNASVTPLLKNTLDWVSRVRQEGESGLEVYRTRVFAIAGASPGNYGAMRSLLHLRQILEVGLGASVIPQQIAVPRAMDAFEQDGSLKDHALQTNCKHVVEQLAIAARKFML
jgi:NAD(P)H-dependent FMN reductase